MSAAYAPGTPCWVDTMSSDFDGAVRFYSGLLGWEAEVDDCDAAAARCRDLGGTGDRASADSPHGRLAGVRDTTGAAFHIIAQGG
ncbi:VOC family protein [Tomitella fengzijianii]|uniref:VOC family protein n=1 Tax=Tomitella fengzijianii TaxID=2597660 RepID=A0A516X628_9ACTN|nr:hypothetical protein [Tomitella fengzijianii]QDQ98483.1 hypothetical protein FO059_15590 [Tomitella fengzijianii]